MPVFFGARGAYDSSQMQIAFCTICSVGGQVNTLLREGAFIQQEQSEAFVRVDVQGCVSSRFTCKTI